MFFRRFVKTFNKWIDRHRKNVVLFECPKENDDFQQGERQHGCAPSRGDRRSWRAKGAGAAHLRESARIVRAAERDGAAQ